MSITAEGICNMALGHLKIGKQIANLLTDQSAEASACNLFYQTAKLLVFRDFKWPFATNIVQLALIQTYPFPNVNGDTEWSYAYQYPADAANIVRILSGIRQDSRQSRTPYRVFVYQGTKMILTDMQNAQMEYTTNNLKEDSFDPDFIMALSYRLAVYIAPRVTAGDPFKLGAECMKFYMMELDSARSNALNEEQMEEDPESEMIRARSGDIPKSSRGGIFGV